MKLSFSLSKKSQSKPSASAAVRAGDNAEGSTRVYLTEFDGSQTPATNPGQNRVIPPKANEWRPHKKMKNLDLPLQSDDAQHSSLQFEVEPAASSADPTSSDSMSYGLNLRKSESNPNSNLNPASTAVSSTNGGVVDPLLNKLREDLKRLPEDVGFDEFDDMPVEGFGRALMAGYGWVEGRGIGRNAKEDVKIFQYTKRTAKEGLGFTGQLPEMPSTGKQDDDGREKASGGDTDRSERGKGGQVVNNGKEKGFYVGKEVRIVGGKGIGMKGRIIEVKSRGEVAVLRLSRTKEEVKVDIRDLAEIGSTEEERCLRKLEELKMREKSIAGDKSSGRDVREMDKGTKRSSRDSVGEDGGMRVRKKERKREREEIKGKDGNKLSWLTCHIRVRIISKHRKGGKLYLKKGEVVDMVGPTTCDITIDDSKELIQGVDQEELETAIPKRGGPVLVLYGRHKGVYGRLVERDTEKETGVVQDADTHELINVRLEQIAEYIGDPSYIGY